MTQEWPLPETYAAVVDLAAQLKRKAVAHGAAGFGICGPEPFVDTAVEMQRRRGDGSHAALTFTYTDPAVATDIRRSFPWAESLVVVAWSYLPAAGSPGPPAAGTGRVARFATEDHYRGLRASLDAMAAVLHDADHRVVPLADDNRLVDRAAAVRAGIGWWGKNTMVLAPGHGPWLLLGSVITDAVLPPSAPMVRDCGSCDACIPACPTGALIAPGILDARRCLARWAQAPGVIPRIYRRLMGDRVYGCDDCLDACPPGARAVDGATEPRGRVNLAALLAESDAELLGKYAHFYLPRRRPNILRRNAIVAMGNAGGPTSLPILAGYLGHPDPLLRLHAAWAVAACGAPGKETVLHAAHRAERAAEVRAEIQHALR